MENNGLTAAGIVDFALPPLDAAGLATAEVVAEAARRLTVRDAIEAYAEMQAETVTEHFRAFLDGYLAMRGVQQKYFSSKKENRWGDKNLLAMSKELEADLDELARQELAGLPVAGVDGEGGGQ